MQEYNNEYIHCFPLYFHILILLKKISCKTKLTKEQCYSLKGVGGDCLLNVASNNFKTKNLIMCPKHA